MSAQTNIPLKVAATIFFRKAADGSVLTVADGDNNVIPFIGCEGDYSDVTTKRREVAEVVSKCLTKAAESYANGADATMSFECKTFSPDFQTEFMDNYVADYDPVTGDIQVSVPKASEEDCKPCNPPKGEASDDWAVVQICCPVDCENNNNGVGFKARVFRCVTTALSSRASRKGGGDVNSLGYDINLTLGDGDGFGFGPGDMFPSVDINGNPSCNPVTDNISLPDDLDVVAFLDECIACGKEWNGCFVGAADLAAFPILDNLLLGG